jgi:hypothetical protein
MEAGLRGQRTGRAKCNRRADSKERGKAAEAAEAAEAEPRRKRKAQAEPEQTQDEARENLRSPSRVVVSASAHSSLGK